VYAATDWDPVTFASTASLGLSPAGQGGGASLNGTSALLVATGNAEVSGNVALMRDNNQGLIELNTGNLYIAPFLFGGTANIQLGGGKYITTTDLNVGNITTTGLTINGSFGVNSLTLGNSTVTGILGLGNVGNIQTNSNGNINLLSFGGNINMSGTVNVTGAVSASGTITGGNLATAGTASATGTITGGNLATAGTASATGTITGGNLATAGTVSATGNITGGNLSATGRVIAVNYTETQSNVGSISGTFTPNIANGSIQYATLTGNITANSITSINNGQSMFLVLTQDGTGNRLLNSSWKFAGNVRTLSTAANATDVISVVYANGTYYASLTTGYA
jgi:hypothetical protein